MIDHWNLLYKGFIVTDGKKSVEKLKGRTEFKSYDEVKDCESFGGVLKDDVVLIDVDDSEQSEKLMKIIENLQLDCKVYDTGRGRHFLFKNQGLSRNMTGTQLAIGLKADIKLGSRTSYEVLKVNNEERFCEWDIEDDIEDYQQLPKWLHPVRETVDFSSLDDGDGRNQALFNYELTLQAADFSVDECRECIRLINQYVLRKSLSNDELETILRDEAFQKPVFFEKDKFLFDRFAEYIKAKYHIKKINGRLWLYDNGIYVPDYNDKVESVMIKDISLKKTQRKEALDYLKLLCEDEEPDLSSNLNLIAFKNGLYNLDTKQLEPFDPEYNIPNQIPWNYNPDAKSELVDITLDKLSCGDREIRQSLIEVAGACLYRSSTLGGGMAAMLVGDKQNGKSTFINMIKSMLGNGNYSALDIRELGDRFSTSMLYGKLANLGDDISSEFILDPSVFKKLVTGEPVKAEEKGMMPFNFVSYATQIYSANDIPRIKDKTGAVLRRLLLIPLNGKFTPETPGYDPNLRIKLACSECMEYFICLALEGLQNVLANKAFTIPEKAIQQKRDYERENNPILSFIEEVGKDGILNEITSDVYKRYQVFCADNGFQPESNTTFSKDIARTTGFKIKKSHTYRNDKRISVQMFVSE